MKREAAIWIAGVVCGTLTGIAASQLIPEFWPRVSIIKKKKTIQTEYMENVHTQETNTYTMDDEILMEQFTRNIQFFGSDGQKKVQKSFVVVVGLGGVGSHAATMLLRSGVGKLRLVDFDQVSLSSLNRHAVATREDVGFPKATCLKKHFAEIYPECEVEAISEMFDETTAERILADSPDFVLDCIDNIDTKVLLIASCIKKNLKVLAATGAGARADPTRIRIADLSESSVDPLSRTVRHRLRRYHGVENGVTVVFSTERPKAKLLPVPNDASGQEANPADYQVVPGFRVRIIPVLGTIPAIFGQMMASFTLTTLAGMEIQPEPIISLDVEHYGTLHHRLIEREELIYGTAADVEVDKEEVAYVIRELWRGRSARNQNSRDVGRGMWRSMNSLTLTRWDHFKPPTVDNLLLLTFTEAEAHEATTLEEVKNNEPEFYSQVCGTFERARQEFSS